MPSLQQFLEADMKVKEICERFGLGKAWEERGGEYIEMLGFLPTELSDFAGWRKRKVARQEARKRSNEAELHGPQNTRATDEHGHYSSADKPMLKTDRAIVKNLETSNYGHPERSESNNRQPHATDKRLPQAGRAEVEDSKVLEIEGPEQAYNNKLDEAQIDMLQPRAVEMHMLQTDRAVIEGLGVNEDPATALRREETRPFAGMSAPHVRPKNFTNSKVDWSEAARGRVCKPKAAKAQGLAKIIAMREAEALRLEHKNGRGAKVT
jgi:hypothetical protein